MDKQYHISAKPTLFKGVQFRSRLEARWAAMFDLLGWEWIYEPYDLDGWSPDFFVRFARLRRTLSEVRQFSLLVEVKPFHDAKEFESHRISEWPDGHPSFGDTAWPGTTPRPSCVGFGADPSVVWCLTLSDSEDSYGPVEFEYLVDVRQSTDACAHRISSLWKQAGNDVQWSFRDGRRVTSGDANESSQSRKHEPLIIRRREPRRIY